MFAKITIKKILIFLSVLVLLLVFAGAVFYKYVFVAEANKEFIALLPFLVLDEDLGWKNNAGFDDVVTFSRYGKTYAHRYAIDSSGRRVLPTDHLPDNGITEIWVLGDSSPFGLGVEAENTFSNLLDNYFKDQNVGARNYSVVGYGSAQQYLLLKKLLSGQAHPEIAILWFGFNDVEFTRSTFLDFDPLSPIRFFLYEHNYNRILKLLNQNNVKVIINTIPHFEESASLDRINEFLRSKGDNKRYYLNDMDKKFSGDGRRELYAPLDDVLPMRYHPGEKGHKIISEELYKLIKSFKLL